VLFSKFANISEQIPSLCLEPLVSPKKNNRGKYWVRHFVIFSLQNARGGFADIVLLCGWQDGVCV